jgi:hypothetical protein
MTSCALLLAGRTSASVASPVDSLSRSDTTRYGCRLADSAALHNDSFNAACWVRNLARWVRKDGVISEESKGRRRGVARHWSELRPPLKASICRESTNRQNPSNRVVR